MKVKIEEIHSKNMFPGLIIGKPRDGHYEESLKEMEEILGSDIPLWSAFLCGVFIFLHDYIKNK